MRKVYIAKRLKTRTYKLNRNPTMKNRAAHDHRFVVSHRQKLKFKRLPLLTLSYMNRSIDHLRDEEIDETVQSIVQAKDGVRKGHRGYKNAANTLQKLKRKEMPAKVVRQSWRSQKVKSYTATRKMNRFRNAVQLKTLNGKYVRNTRAISNVVNKGATKKALASSMSYFTDMSKQLAKRLVTTLMNNPKVWLIGVAIAAVFLLVMMITNSLGSFSSAAGSIFMVDDAVAVNYKTKVDGLNISFQQRIEDYRNSGYDDVRIDYMNEEGTLQVSWGEILSIVAVKYEQELEFSVEQQSYMEELFEHFNEINTSSETYIVQSCSTNEEGQIVCHDETKIRLIVKVYTYDMEQVFDKIGFDEEQREWVRRLVSEGSIQEQFPGLVGGNTGSSSLTPEELAALMQNLGGDIHKVRLAVIEAALTLEGKVGYFWGGKSPAGWNSNWGTMFMVTAPGSDNTGTYQPYGLDCSGFIDWSFKTAGLGNLFSAGGTSYQWTRTSPISKDEMKPGDLIFKDMPGQGGINHIGIFIGKDQNNNNLYIHCQSGTGVVINSYKGFKYPRRPLLFE